MDCPRCGRTLPDGVRDFGSEQAGVSVVITGVPASRCDSCQESFTTEATRVRMDAIADSARRQAIEQGQGEIVRDWAAAAPTIAADSLGDELKNLAERLSSATQGNDPEQLTAALAQVSEALKTLVTRAREAGIALPDPKARLPKPDSES